MKSGLRSFLLISLVSTHLFAITARAKPDSIDLAISKVLNFDYDCAISFQSPSSSRSRRKKVPAGLQLSQTPGGYYGIIGEGVGTSYEILAATSLERYLRGRGEKMLLVPSLGGREVPAFDGVILNKYGTPTSNVQIKSPRDLRSFHFNQKTETIAQLADKFMDPKNWLVHLKFADNHSDVLKRPLSIKDREHLKTAWNLFGVDRSNPRKTIIVYDLTSHAEVSIAMQIASQITRNGRSYSAPERYPIYHNAIVIHSVYPGNFDFSPPSAISGAIFITRRQVLEIRSNSDGNSYSTLTNYPR